MNQLLQIFASPAWSNVVLALLHSLWLGVVWALLLAAGLRIAGRNADRRYLVSLAALGGLLISTLFAAADGSAQNASAPAPAALSRSDEASSHETPALANSASPRVFTANPPARTSNWIPAAALCWVVGTVLMLLQLAMRLIEIRRASLHSARLDEPMLLDHLRELMAALGVHRAIKLATNASVTVPCVLGIFAPVILLPASLLSGIPAEQMRAILAHELAHIRRHDFLINAFQQFIEALLFFNPAVWWINRQIRLEREACCDALAVSVLPATGVYARALVDFVQSVRAAPPEFQPAFPGDRGSSTLLERIKRLLAPNYQPLVRLPWHSFVAVMLLSAFLLATLWSGSRFAVVLAADLLRAEQRIEKIETLKATIAPEQDARAYTSEDKIKLSGSIRTADGVPLERWPHINIQVTRPRHSFGAGVAPKSDGRFETRVEFGTIYLGTVRKGFAPVFLGPFQPALGGVITNVDLVLSNGFTSTIRVLNPLNEPISGVQLEGTYDHPAGWIPIKLETNDKGEALIQDGVALSMNWKASAKGFQADLRKGVVPRENQVYVWTLQPARATSGTILDARDDRPVSGAKIKLIHRGPKDQVTYSEISDAPLLATTDERGLFTLDTLPSDTGHVLVVEADGHAPRIVKAVFAGQQLPPIRLSGEIFIEGEIRGDLSQLQASPDPFIYVGNPLVIDDRTHLRRAQVPVRIENGVGYFSARNLREGEVQIQAGELMLTFDLSAPRRGLVIDLNPPSARTTAAAERTVIFRFLTPAGAPPVRGVLHTKNWTASDGENRPVAITNNQARIQATVPSWVSCETTGLIGYWIPEQHAIRVEAATNDLVVDLPAVPAGAIHGAVRNSDGSEIGGVMVSVIEVRPSIDKKTPGGLGNLGKHSSSGNDAPTRFIAQPLPLGGEYLLIAYRARQFAASETISLTPEAPIREIELRFVPGQDIDGQVLDASGNPLSRIKVKLLYGTPFSYSFGVSEAVFTDTNGRFSYRGLNPSMPGSYLLIVDEEPGWQRLNQPVTFNGDPQILTLKRGLQLRGTVLNDRTGQPLSGVDLYVLPDHSQPGPFMDADAKTDSQGAFAFTQLSEGEYSINTRTGTIVNGGISRHRARPNQTTPLIIRIEPQEP